MIAPTLVVEIGLGAWPPGRSPYANPAPRCGRRQPPSQPPRAPGPAQAFDFTPGSRVRRISWRQPLSGRQGPLPPAMAESELRSIPVHPLPPDHSLWGDAGAGVPTAVLPRRTHLQPQPVHVYEVVDGQAREIVYDPSMFEWNRAASIRHHEGSRGLRRAFRVQFVTNWRADVAAFLGAAYFRAVGGDTRQYGLSARALAVDTAFPAAGGVSALHLVLVRAARQRIRAR